MLNLTRKVDYGVLILTHLALRAGEAVSSRELARTYGLSRSLTASVLKTLQRRGLVTSSRGVHGGYSLGAEPSGISVNDVILALEGPWSIVECRAERDSEVVFCDVYRICPIRGAMRVLGDRVREVLETTTIQSFVDDARTRNVAPPEGFVELPTCLGGRDGDETVLAQDERSRESLTRDNRGQ